MIRFLSILLVWHSCQAFVASKGSNNGWGPMVLQAANGAADDCVTTADVLSLDSIRSTLIRQEETIIFALIERSQFRLNPSIYVKGAFGDLGVPVGSTPPKEGDDAPLSFLEYMLVGTVRYAETCRLAKGHARQSLTRAPKLRRPYIVEFVVTRPPKSMHSSQTDSPRDCCLAN